MTGPATRRWRLLADAHGADGLVLDGGLDGTRVSGVLDSACHGRWVLARSDWDDSFAMLEWLARQPRGHGVLARRLRAVIQQRMVAAPPLPGAPGARRPVLEVLFNTEAMLAALQNAASARQMNVLARGDGFRSLGERIQAGVAAGVLDPNDAARALA